MNFRKKKHLDMHLEIHRRLPKAILPLAVRSIALSLSALAFLAQVSHVLAAAEISGDDLLEQVSIDKKPVDRSQPMPSSFSDVISVSSPSVVTIVTKKTIEYYRSHPFYDDPFFRRFFGDPRQQQNPQQQRPQRRQESGMGSGVIITSNGYVLTNNHVVADGDEIIVKLSQGKKEYEAEVIGTDPKSDIAILKIDAEELPAITLGDSTQLKVGDVVMAIGSPYGLSQTVTQGIVSALSRNDVGIVDYANFIQTDAAINRGNSGGALIDIKGRLVGINTAIVSSSGGNNGIGFAIPIDMVLEVITSLVDDGKVTRGYLGITMDRITAELGEALGLKNLEGALINEVMPESPAAKAGLAHGDVIVEFEGKKVVSPFSLRVLVGRSKPGSEVSFGIIREGKTRQFKVVLSERPDDEELGSSTGGKASKFLEGVSIKALSDEERKNLGLDEKYNGVLVTAVEEGSSAADAGLQVNDVITQVGQVKVNSVKAARQAIKDSNRKVLLLRIVRNNQPSFIGVKVESKNSE